MVLSVGWFDVHEYCDNDDVDGDDDDNGTTSTTWSTRRYHAVWCRGCCGGEAESDGLLVRSIRIRRCCTFQKDHDLFTCDYDFEQIVYNFANDLIPTINANDSIAIFRYFSASIEWNECAQQSDWPSVMSLQHCLVWLADFVCNNTLK